ncbi:MAG: permease-like cell division protein FtsX [Clostridia bacterium]|nr:permease-like cell division protein FtsX [Clostridia bacterium]
MRVSIVKYFFSQASKNIVRNGFMTLASLFTIASCLIILGVFTLLTLNVNYITEQVKEQCEIQVFIKKDTDAKRVRQLQDEIYAISNVKEAVLFTKEDMLNYAKQDMFQGKEEQLTGFEEDNPFSDSYKITLKDIAKTNDTVQKLEKLDSVDHVVNKQDVVNTILSLSGAIRKLSIVIMLMLLIISVVIISNTIKLTVFNRRKEINIMKYIGATDCFIRVPFIIEGILIGFFGALISFGLVSWGYIMLEKFMKSIEFEMFRLLSYGFVAVVIGALFAVMGCVIGMVGSILSMRKYLKV